jgi:excisionase family DNA binding protein
MDRLDKMKNRILTVQEVSSYLRVHPSTIYKMVKKKQLPAFRVGSDWRFSVEAIDKWRVAAESGTPIPRAKTTEFEVPATPSSTKIDAPTG